MLATVTISRQLLLALVHRSARSGHDGVPRGRTGPATARRHRRASMTGNVGRREFVQGVGLVVGALAATAGYPPALSQLTTNVGSKPMTYAGRLVAIGIAT